MNITKFSILRPLALLMAVLAIFIFGIKSYRQLKTSMMPETNIPFVLVQTAYPGASAEVIENQVSAPIEKDLYSISGLSTIHSYSMTNASVVMLEFSMKTDPDKALNDVNKRLNELVPTLPKDITTPKVQKVDNNATPVIDYALYSNNKEHLQNYIENTLRPKIERLEGVGQVNVFGLDEKQVRITLNKNAADQNVTVSTISDALANKTFGAKLPARIPLGIIKENGRETSVEINSELVSIEEIRNYYINTAPQGAPVNPVKISDLADVQIVNKDRDNFYRVNGKDAVGISITKQSDASDVDVAQRVKELLGGEKPLPVTKMIAGVVGMHFQKEQYSPSIDLKKEGITAKVTSDQSIWVKESVDGVIESLIEGILLTGLFLLLFLRSIRSTLIVLLAIPTSIIVTFIGMKTFGFTLNILSLLGIAMSVGILVDDSIVVIENIFAKLRGIKDPKEAALVGRSEIAAAAIAITLVDVVVYLPLALLSGMVGQFFRQFAAVVVVATLSSLAVAFTLTPMLTSRLVRQKDEKGYSWLAWSEKGIEKLKEWYGTLLSAIIKTGWRVAATIILIFAVLAGSIAVSAPHLKQEFIVSGDDGRGSLSVEFPSGTSVEAVNTAAAKIETKLASKDQIKDYFVTIGSSGSNTASLSFDFGPKEQRSISNKELTAALQKEITAMVPEEAIVSASQAGSGWGTKEVQYTMTGDNFDKLVEIQQTFEKKVRDKNILKDISFSLGKKVDGLVVDVNQDTSKKGVSAGQIAMQTAGKIKPSESGSLIQGSTEIPIVVEDSQQIKNENELKNILLGNDLKIGDSTNVTIQSAYKSIERIDKQRSITFAANLNPGIDSGKATREIDKIVKELNLPSNFAIKADSSTRIMQEGFADLGNAMMLSIGLIFMIMVALYESLLIPFVIMFTLPTAIAGSFLLLYALGAPLDITAMVGFIALMGLVAKNGILLVDFMEKERKSGVPLREAVINAGRRRLRPILMTTLAIIVASIPLVLGNVPGSEFRRGVAIVYIGGLLSSLILTLLLIPAVYVTVVSIRERLFKRFTSKPDLKTKKV